MRELIFFFNADFCPYLGRRDKKNKKKLPRRGHKSGKKKKKNSQIKKLHLKRIPIKTITI